MLQIAIIGSGPAGCYLADHLLRVIPDARIDVIERLPVPFGLVRYGVAPDHQGTKAVARVLDRTLSRDRVSFFGNVEVGKDVTLDQLRSMYHAVVLATGAPNDRKLEIPGESLPGVIGSGAFVGWYNGHPDHAAPLLRSVRSAVLIGNGNVALDVARILAKGRDELKGFDLAPEVVEALSTLPIENIHIVGRRGPADARFSEHELAELGTVRRAQPVVEDPDSLSGDSAVVKVLREFATRAPTPATVRIRFHFNLTPAAFVGEHALQAVRFRTAQGDERDLPAQLAVTCVGYESSACCSAVPENGVFRSEAGKIDEGLYVVGWAKRGPSGTIPTNRAEALQVAQKIADELEPPSRTGTLALTQHLRDRGVDWVDYAGWKLIEAAELAGACDERCRLKLTTVRQMLDAAHRAALRRG